MRLSKSEQESFISLINEIIFYPGHPEIRHLLSQKFNEVPFGLYTEKLNYFEAHLDQIKNYLALEPDYLIDYSGFKGPVQKQLYSFSLEMSRNQLATRGNSPNFREFCQYGFFQIEYMMDYLLNTTFDFDINQIYTFLLNFISTKINIPQHINDISAGEKLFALEKALKISNHSTTYLYFLNNIRNEVSHPKAFQEKVDENNLTAYLNEGFTLDMKFRKINSDKRKENIFNKGRNVILKREECWNDVIKSIEEFKNQVLNNLNTKEFLKTNSHVKKSNTPTLKDKFPEELKNMFPGH